MVSVGHELQDNGAISLDAPFFGELGNLFDLENVLPIASDPRNHISSLVHERVRRRPLDGSTHSIQIVLANVDDWKLPERSHVHCFKELALVACSISIHSHTHIGLIFVLVAKCYASADRDLGSHDSIPSKVPVFGIVEVHGSTLSLRGPGLLLHHLSQNPVRSVTSGKSLAVVSVGCDHRILKGQRSLHPNWHSFLSIIKMAESSDLLGLVKIVSSDFSPPHHSHILKVLQKLILSACGLLWHIFLIQSVHFRFRQLDCDRRECPS
mmetsp:Transcript_18399/g.17508  ORF Transcript_18399/g.17508 Transcript_18399/m.17508 type:complete len:267 (-) Transcript_18399:77-877(-)